MFAFRISIFETVTWVASFVWWLIISSTPYPINRLIELYPTLLKLQGWLFLQLHGIFHCMGAEWCFQVKNRFFPSSEVMRVLKMELFQLKNFEHVLTHDVTWWEEFESAHWTETGNIQPCYLSNVGCIIWSKWNSVYLPSPLSTALLAKGNFKD